MQGWFNIRNMSNVIQHINRMKKKIYMVISIDVEKALDKTEYPFIIKTLRKLGIEGNFYSLIKGMYEKPIANIQLNDERWKTSPSDQDQGCLLSSLFQHCTRSYLFSS